MSRWNAKVKLVKRVGEGEKIDSRNYHNFFFLLFFFLFKRHMLLFVQKLYFYILKPSPINPEQTAYNKLL